MNSQFALAFLVSVFAFGIITAVPVNEQCNPNEEFHSCGTACPPTCKDPRPSGLCTKQCVVGCFCKEGYLRHDNGACVQETNCANPIQTKPMPEPIPHDTDPIETRPMPEPIAPEHILMPGPVMTKPLPAPSRVCGDNEEYRECKGCDATCDNLDPVCTRICLPGCACKEDHVRDANGRCMHKTKCQPQPVNPLPLLIKPEEPKCGPNEIFRSCGSVCPPTCENPHPSPFCSTDCVVGCFCQEGYLRNAKGECVLEANCDNQKRMIAEVPSSNRIPRVPPPRDQCPTDREIYSDCGTTQDCIVSCDSPIVYLIRGVPQIPEKCKNVECAPACVCKSPYYRNATGQCVERKECNKTQ